MTPPCLHRMCVAGGMGGYAEGGRRGNRRAMWRRALGKVFIQESTGRPACVLRLLKGGGGGELKTQFAIKEISRINSSFAIYHLYASKQVLSSF